MSQSKKANLKEALGQFLLSPATTRNEHHDVRFFEILHEIETMVGPPQK